MSLERNQSQVCSRDAHFVVTVCVVGEHSKLNLFGYCRGVNVLQVFVLFTPEIVVSLRKTANNYLVARILARAVFTLDRNPSSLCGLALGLCWGLGFDLGLVGDVFVGSSSSATSMANMSDAALDSQGPQCSDPYSWVRS